MKINEIFMPNHMKIIENQYHKSLKEWQFADACGLCRWILLSHSGRDILFSLRVQHQTICSYLFYITTTPSIPIPYHPIISYHISPYLTYIHYISLNFIIILYSSMSFVFIHGNSKLFSIILWASLALYKMEKIWKNEDM